MARIVLASGSPRRQELLQRIGITDFTVRVPEADESYDPSMTPQEIVCHISRQKSMALSSAEDEIVINVCLNSGEASAAAFGCDLTYEYVKINGDYRT